MEYQNVTDNTQRARERIIEGEKSECLERKKFQYNVVIVVRLKWIAANKQLYKYATGIIIGHI